MSFLEYYKHVDNLLKRKLNSDIGVTRYLQEMSEVGLYNTIEYKKLRHYRHIRNEIVHENNVNENNSCTPQDEQWLKDFYHLVANNEDSLSIYRKKIMNRNKKASSSSYKKRTNTKKYFDYFVIFILICSAYLLMVVLFRLIYEK